MLHPLIEEWDTELRSGDPLGFPGYAEAVAALDRESVRTGRTDHYVVVAGDFSVLGGSMGAVHGEKVVRAFDRAVRLRLPVVVVTRSGGARMQEGMLSLMQMARTAAAVARHHDAGLLSIAVHRSPTTGGVLASYGSLCDLRVAESGATIGFAGPRVVEQTVHQSVEGRSHTAETARSAGLVDAVEESEQLGDWVHAALGLLPRPLVLRPLPELEDEPAGTGPWATVLRARRVGRPTGIDVAAVLCSSWTELGEGIDPTLRAGLATVADRRVVVLASDRYAGSGRPGAAAYRLAQRSLALAGRLGLAVVTLVDLRGAEPGPDAENDGIATEIARTFAAMATLPTVCVSVCVGEGGSGGALALAGGDRLLMQTDAVFSVIGPEGAAVILERDTRHVAAMAEQLRLTSADLLELGVIDDVVGEHPDDVVKAVVEALDVAEPGDRFRRVDSATARWLRGPPVQGPGAGPPAGGGRRWQLELLAGVDQIGVGRVGQPGAIVVDERPPVGRDLAVVGRASPVVQKNRLRHVPEVVAGPDGPRPRRSRGWRPIVDHPHGVGAVVARWVGRLRHHQAGAVG